MNSYFHFNGVLLCFIPCQPVLKMYTIMSVQKAVQKKAPKQVITSRVDCEIFKSIKRLAKEKNQTTSAFVCGTLRKAVTSQDRISRAA